MSRSHLQRSLWGFASDVHGATAVEFALVAAPFLFTLVGAVEAGLDLYFRNSLDNAAQNVARQIMTGAVQGMKINITPINAAQFRTNVVCPMLPASMSCNDVIVNVQTFTEGVYPSGFYNFVNSSQSALSIPPLDNTKTLFCIGNGGAYVLLQVMYPMPLITSVFSGGTFATYKGNRVRLLVSNAAFRNEPFPVGSYVAPAGC